MRVMAKDSHPARKVDPFGLLPCGHDTVVVHITDAESMGEDLVECTECTYIVRLADLYAGIRMPGADGPPPT